MPAWPGTTAIRKTSSTPSEAEGFIWGGRWYHYDTMHFEYRPELLDDACYADPVPTGMGRPSQGGME